jgi:excisionase family DNA binding protein
VPAFDQKEHRVELKPISVKEPEACAITGIKRSKMLELTYAGVIPSYKVGRSRFFRVSDLEEWVRKQVEASTSSSEVA